MNSSSLASFFVASLSSLALFGCGSSVSDGTGGGGGEGGGAPDVCASFEDPPQLGAPQRSVGVRFVNDTNADIFLGAVEPGCGVYIPYALERGGVSVKPSLDICQFSCGQLMEGQCACPAVCAMPEITRIVPGGVYEALWGGMEYEPATLPAECQAEGCGGACYLPALAQGAYTVLGVAHPALGDCVPNDTCSCEPDANGSCTFNTTAGVAGAPIEATASYDFGSGEATVELRFE
jgi:hypothetical protein